MVVGGGEADNLVHPPMGAPQASIDNIMSGISNTGTVKMNNHRKKLRQRFDIIKKLGQGTYGKVQLGINKETGQEVAIKTIKKCKIETDADLVRIRREVQIMSSVQHPNIIHIYEVFENKEKMVLVMEFAAGGELYDYLSERKVLSEEEARRVFRQISTAVYYCHKHKICHRDLKLENILLDENGNAKIADFGLSNVFDEQRLLATFCGSPLYASPEIVKGTPYQGPEVDCWSLGVLLYTLVYGAMPFDGSNFKRLVKQISAGDYYEPKKPSPASPLIKDMLTVCPKRRATIEQICNHWWVNTGYTESCLDLAEELANQTPVRLDVLLSLAPSAITSDQLVVPGPTEEIKPADRVARSHSVGSIRDIGNTEAERRILDMVAAGGEAALAPSPTRTITPAENTTTQAKRKLETTISTENATEIVKKKEKPTETIEKEQTVPVPTAWTMDVDPLTEVNKTNEKDDLTPNLNEAKPLDVVAEMCDELLDTLPKEIPPEKQRVIKKKIVKPETAQETIVEEKSVPAAATTPIKKTPVKTVKKIVKKSTDENEKGTTSEMSTKKSPERKGSITSVGKPSDRKSRVFETAEKFQNASAQNNDKLKKIFIAGVSVGNFKKEFERKASLTNSPPISLVEKKFLEKKENNNSNERQVDSRKSSMEDSEAQSIEPDDVSLAENLEKSSDNLNQSESKSSIASFSLEEARRSMENSIALLNQAKTEPSELDQLCSKTENVTVSDDAERLKKLKNAREIIGNAIPIGRIGVRKPPVPFGANGRSSSGSVVPSSTLIERKPIRLQGSDPSSLRSVAFGVSSPEQKMTEIEPLPVKKVTSATMPPETPINTGTKTSRAEITLKSATLPRRKTTKAQIQLEIQPKDEPPMRFHTEMQHQIPDIQSAPIHEQSTPYSPLSIQHRAVSLDPQPKKEYVIPIQKSGFATNSKNSLRSGSLSRQSTNESDSELTNAQLSTQTFSSLNQANQQIKKSPREFIIPIAVEGVGFVTPRASSLEPSESSYSNPTSTFSRLSRPRRFGSLLSDRDSEDESPFHKMHSSIGRENESDEPRFAMHRLRTTRPLKKIAQDPNDSASSCEDDDEDGFEILTAENLFSTLLSRVRALTNRLNVNNNTTSSFPTSRLMSNMRQAHCPFWNHDPFTSRLNNGSGPWRHSLSRELGTDMNSMFTQSGATLPRGLKNTTTTIAAKNNGNVNNNTNANNNNQSILNQNYSIGVEASETLDLADLDLSQLRLTKKDLETLSSLTPGLPKHFQDQLLAQLPPNQARKLYRTLSMQNNSPLAPVKVYKRSLSGGRESSNIATSTVNDPMPNCCLDTYERNQTLDTNKHDSLGYNSGRVKASRSSSRCVSSEELYDNSSLSSDINDKYKSCNPSSTDNSSYTVDKLKDGYGSGSSVKYYETILSRRSSISPTKECSSRRPPSGCLSPAFLRNDSPTRRKPTHRIVSRFLRPDFFDTPREESCYVKDKKQKDLDTQAVLREIRERSRERSLDRRNKSGDNSTDSLYYLNVDPKYIREHRNSSIPSVPRNTFESTLSGHLRNKSVDRCLNININKVPDSKYKPIVKTVTANKNYLENGFTSMDNDKSNFFADKILDELQNISFKKLTKTENVRDEKEDEISIKEKLKLKKAKSKETVDIEHKRNTDQLDDNQSKSSTVNNLKMVTSLTNEIESVNMPKSLLNEKTNKISKLIRPKSYPSKDPELAKKQPSPEMLENIKEVNSVSSLDTNRAESGLKNERPKSYPASKITPPKDSLKYNKNCIGMQTIPDDKSVTYSGTTINKLINKVEKDKINNGTKSIENASSSDTNNSTIKKIKIIKKTIKTDSTGVKETDIVKSNSNQNTENDITPKKDNEKQTTETVTKEKSPEKKPSRGLLYTIGQKFEKFRENSKTKDKKALVKNTKPNNESTNGKSNDAPPHSSSSQTEHQENEQKEQKTTSNVQNPSNQVGSTIMQNEKPIERKSRIDTMIRNLRERSLPRAPALTESGLIKRAVSVEDMTGAFNRCTVNKVLGLFKKIEKDQIECRVEKTKSTNTIDPVGSTTNSSSKERPKSSGFVSKLRKGRHYTGAKSDSIVMLTDSLEKHENLDKINGNLTKPTTVKFSCQNSSQENLQNVTKRHSNNGIEQSIQDKERMKNNRKGLVLDLSRLDKTHEPDVKLHSTDSTSNNYSKFSLTNHNNNYIQSITSNQINGNDVVTPSYDSMTNYSSDSRSLHDDCASTSTFLSPTDEPELYFDDWSVCSEDNFTGAASTPSISRLSRNSQVASPMFTNANCSESVIDRIKRRSFYSRFNENKPKRQQSIAGDSSREYYRDTIGGKLKSRPSEHLNNSTLDYPRSEPYRSHSVTKSYSDASKLLPSHSKQNSYEDDFRDYRPNEYLRTKSNYNLPLPYSSTSSKGHLSTNEYKYKSDNLNINPTSKTSNYNTSTTSMYGTYNPKRRTSSYSSNGTTSTSTMPSSTTSTLDAYATLGKKLRPYNNRSISLLDSSTCNTSTVAYRRDHRGTPDFGNIIRPKYRMRTPSVPRSPTNI